MTFEKATSESSSMKSDFSAQVVAVVYSLDAVFARVKRLECGIAEGTEKTQSLSAKLQETCQTANRQLVEDRDFVQDLNSRVAAAKAELKNRMH